MAMLTARTAKARKAAGRRIDLLVDLGSQTYPLILDLKFGQQVRATENELDRMATAYGPLVAEVIDDPVDCRILAVTFGGRATWSSVRTIEPA